MSFKTIKVNPIFLSADSSGFTAKNKTRKEKPAGISLGQSNNIKKKLIARIKNFQQNSKTAPLANTAVSTQAVNMDVFSDSVQFLDDLARDKEEQKREKKNTTLKKKQPANAYMNIATELPPELNWDTIAPAPKAAGPSHAAQTAPGPSHAAAQTAPGPSHAAAQTAPGPSHTAPLAQVPLAPQVPLAQWQAQPQPSYSNLKSGTRPTYRTWLRTTQKQKAVRPATEETSLLAPTSFAPTSFAPTSFAPTSFAPTSFAPTAFAPTAFAVSTEPLSTTAFVPTSFVPNGTTSFVPTAFVPPEAAATTSFSAPADTAPASVPNGTTSFAAPAFAYTPSLKPRRKRITRTLKYKLGKHANGKVSVLIKNSQTRRKIQTEQALLKQKSILDIKNHLRSNNLLKVGSNAPNDVLRHLYEQSILAGQVENKAKETLLHNYFNEEKK
jgi:hypothetical protein